MKLEKLENIKDPKAQNPKNEKGNSKIPKFLQSENLKTRRDAKTEILDNLKPKQRIIRDSENPRDRKQRRSGDPETWNAWNLDTRILSRSAWIQKPETRNQKPRTNDSETWLSDGDVESTNYISEV